MPYPEVFGFTSERAQFLQEMLNISEVMSESFYRRLTRRVTVRDIMTPRSRLIACRPDTSIKDAVSILAENDFDQMPVIESERILGYVMKDDLQRQKNDTIMPSMKSIEIDRLTGSNTSVVRALPSIVIDRFRYVLDGSKIVGLVTYADFDKRPVRTLLYALLSNMESCLVKLMRLHNPDVSHWLGNLNTSQLQQVNSWHNKRKLEGTELDELDCFSLFCAFEAIRKEPSLIAEVGDNFGDYRAIVDLRNKISHPGLDVAASLSQLDQLIGAKRRLLELQDKLRGSIRRLERK